MATEPDPRRAGAEPSDPLTGFATRVDLLADLAARLDPSSEPSVLAIFHLGGYREYVELYGSIEGDALLERLARCLGEALAPHATCYRPRRDEFAAIVEAPGPAAEALLEATVSALNAAFAASRIALSFGTALLPDEAFDPIDALSLADTRLYLVAAGRQARERRAAPRGVGDGDRATGAVRPAER